MLRRAILRVYRDERVTDALQFLNLNDLLSENDYMLTYRHIPHTPLYA